MGGATPAIAFSLFMVALAAAYFMVAGGRTLSVERLPVSRPC